MERSKKSGTPLPKPIELYTVQHQFLHTIRDIAFFVTDKHATVLEWNEGCETLYGYTREEALGKRIFELIVPPHERSHFQEHFSRESWSQRDETEHRTKEGATILVYQRGEFLTDSTGERYFFSLCIDVAKLKQIKTLSHLLHSVGSDKSVDESRMVVISFDRNARINGFNPSAEEVTGYSKEEVLGRHFITLFLPESYREKMLKTVQKAFKERRSQKMEAFPIICKNGDKKVLHWEYSVISDRRHSGNNFLLLGHEKSDDAHLQERLEYLANYDSLTDLPNKNLLYERLDNAINRAARSNEKLVTMFLNLDNFKSINHTLGYEIGDRLLQSVANRLYAKLRDYDTLARFGGDEFVLVFEKIDDEMHAASLAKRVMEVFQKPFMIKGNELFLTANMGISFFPSDGNDSTTLIKNANLAMQRAKENPSTPFQIFRHQMHEEVTKRVMLERNLRKAIENGEFFVEYQPQIDTHSRKIVGAEALIRWNHPQLSRIPPLDFIPVAEDTGMILEIGQIVLEEAIHQMQRWHTQGFEDLKISVNISGVQLLQSNLIETVDTVLKASGFDPRYLELELTESILMENIERASSLLSHFKRKKIQLSIDDFGTGYSSLAYLKKLPIDTLKIDQSFIKNIQQGENDKVIVNAIIAMAHSLGLQVIAEGVERSAQYDHLKTQSCDILQGYYFKEPLDAKEFEQLITQHRTLEGRDYEPHHFDFDFEEKLKRYSDPTYISL